MIFKYGIRAGALSLVSSLNGAGGLEAFFGGSEILNGEIFGSEIAAKVIYPFCFTICLGVAISDMYKATSKKYAGSPPQATSGMAIHLDGDQKYVDDETREKMEKTIGID